MLSSSDSVHHPGFCRTSIRASSSCSSTCEPPQHMASMQMARARPAALYELAPRPHPLHEPSSIVGAGDVVVRPPSRRREPVSSVAVVVCVEGVDRPPALGLGLRHLVHLLRTSSSCPGPLHICPGPPIAVGMVLSGVRYRPPARAANDCGPSAHRAEQSTADGRAGTSKGYSTGTQGAAHGGRPGRGGDRRHGKHQRSGRLDRPEQPTRSQASRCGGRSAHSTRSTR